MHRWLATVKTIAQCLTYMYVLVNNIWELVMVDLGSPHVLQLILAAQLFRSRCLLCLFPVLITTVLSINSSALSVCCATQSVPMVILGCALCPLVSVWLLYRYYDFCCFFFPGVFISCCKFALHSCWASFFNMDCANCGSNRLHSQLLCGHYLCADCLTRLIEEGGYCNRCLCTCIGAEPTDTVLVTCGHSLCAFCA